MSKSKLYFVSYSHSKGFGCSSFTSFNGKVTWGDVEDMIKMIESRADVKDIVILSWQPLDGEMPREI